MRVHVGGVISDLHATMLTTCPNSRINDQLNMQMRAVLIPHKMNYIMHYVKLLLLLVGIYHAFGTR